MILAFALSGCSDEPYESSTHDAQALVPRLSDLPPGYSLNLAESFPVPTSKILAEPPRFSAGDSATIRRDRLSGYRAAFTSPRGRPIMCSAAVYRTSAAARKVHRSGAQSVIADLGGRSVRVMKLGEETRAHRLDVGPASYFGILWRYRNILSACATSPSGRQEMTTVALAQQARIAHVIDESGR